MSIEKLSIRGVLKIEIVRQIKAARALLGWSQEDLADSQRCLSSTIVDLSQLMANRAVAQQQSENSSMRSKKPASSSSTKTAEAPVYGYAKRPRARAANRLSRPDNPNWRNEANVCGCSAAAG